MNQPTLSESLVKALEGLPRFALNYVVGFFIVAITDVIVTTLVLGAVLLAILTSPLLAAVGFLFSYVLIRTLQAMTNAIGQVGQGIRFQGEVKAAAINSAGLIHDAQGDVGKSP